MQWFPHDLPLTIARFCRKSSILLAIVAIAMGCGPQDSSSHWLHLTDGFTPTPLVSDADWNQSFEGDSALTIEPVEGAAGVWVVAHIPSEDWLPVPNRESIWRARRSFSPMGVPPEDEGTAQKLESDSGTFTLLDKIKDILLPTTEQDQFTAFEEFVYLKTNEPKPGDMRYSVYVDRGHSIDSRWRVTLDRYHCDGFPIWPEYPEEITTDIPEASALSFATTGFVLPGSESQSEAVVTFRVLLDDEELFRHEQAVDNAPVAERHKVELPIQARSGARLTFSVEGPAAACAILTPVIGPSEIGTPNSRPFLAQGETPRPNILLFVADTFRADSLNVYGGEYEKSITPNLDKFAETSRLFTRAWSPASWTLPAQTSMMTGLYPFQHGADRSMRKIPDTIVTLAETLAKAGYRTGAITDSGLVSRRFGFDQGIQWFDELSSFDDKQASLGRTFNDTLDFIEADDGRPFFLFVQTFRVHGPYLVTDQTREEYKDELRLDGDWQSIQKTLVKSVAEYTNMEEIPPSMVGAVNDLEQLYRGGVVDFDRGWGSFIKEFDRRRLDETSWIVFTSDHGDGFGEHDVLYHGNGVWDSHVRIPMLIRGPSLTASATSIPASLVDVPRTLAEIAGIPSAPLWGGQDLLGNADEVPLFSFESHSSGKPGSVAVIDGMRKLIVDNDHRSAGTPTLRSAYQMDTDKAEQRDYVLEDVEWPTEMFDRLEPAFDQVRQPIFKPRQVHLQPRDIEHLDALGYVDN